MTEAKGLVKENTIGIEVGNEIPDEAIAYCGAIVKKEEPEEDYSNRSMFSILKESFPNLPESAAFSIEEPQVATHSFLPPSTSPLILYSYFFNSSIISLSLISPAQNLLIFFSSLFPCSLFLELFPSQLLSCTSQTAFCSGCLLQLSSAILSCSLTHAPLSTVSNSS